MNRVCNLYSMNIVFSLLIICKLTLTWYTFNFRYQQPTWYVGTNGFLCSIFVDLLVVTKLFILTFHFFWNRRPQIKHGWLNIMCHFLNRLVHLSVNILIIQEEVVILLSLHEYPRRGDIVPKSNSINMNVKETISPTRLGTCECSRWYKPTELYVMRPWVTNKGYPLRRVFSGYNTESRSVA